MLRAFNPRDTSAHPLPHVLAVRPSFTVCFSHGANLSPVLPCAKDGRIHRRHCLAAASRDFLLNQELENFSLWASPAHHLFCP